jgi:hypothetical protein
MLYKPFYEELGHINISLGSPWKTGAELGDEPQPITPRVIALLDSNEPFRKQE